MALAGCGTQSSPRLAPITAPSATLSAPVNLGSVVGFVVDTAFRPLEGARVDVLEGVEAGLFTTADRTGHFVLTGRFDLTTPFRASHHEHDMVTQLPRFSSPGGQPWVVFYLKPVAGAVNIAGEYAMTLAADQTCVDLPEEMRTRNYTATVALASVEQIPADTYFDVTVHSTARTPQSFSGIGVAGHDLGFDGSRNHDGTPTLVEQVGSEAYLSYRPNNGFAVTTVKGAPLTISTSFDGVIDYSVAGTHVRCESAQHRLVMMRK
jgi:hypothetical protein